MAIFFIEEQDEGYAATAGGSVYIVRGTLTDADGAAFDFGATQGNLLRVGDDIYGETGITTSASSGSNLIEIDEGASVYGVARAISLSGINHSVVNAGDISGRERGIYFDGGTDVLENSGTVRATITAVYGAQSGAIDLNNSGLIRGEVSHGVLLEGADSTISNSGDIVGRVTALRFNNLRGTNVVYNDGTLTGLRGLAVADSEGVLIMRNTGTVIGDVVVNGGGDDFTNAGLVVGGVYLGGGADRYLALRGGEALRVVGGVGTDGLFGARADDVFEGEGEADTLDGRGGDDSLNGGLGDDLVAGGGGEDTLTGGAGADTLSGGRAADVVIYGGGDGADLVTDLQRSDTLDLTDFGRDLDSVLAAATQVGRDTVIDLSGGDVLTLASFRLQDLGDVLLV